MNDFAKKLGADSDDPWEDLAEQLFGTTPGKEHTAAQNTGGSGTAGGSKSSAQVPPFNELEAILTGEKPVPTAEPPKKKSLADLLFDEPEEEPAPVFEEDEDEAPPPVKAKRTKRVEPAADLESSEPERTDLRSPQPKPATGSSPQDSYWDALANWNWDDSSGSSQSASPAAEETQPVEPEVSDRSPAPSRPQSGGRSHSGGRSQSGRGGESRGGDKGPRGRGRKDDRSAKGDRPRERPEEVREAPRATRENEERDDRPAPREVVKEEVAPIWDFESETEAPAAPAPRAAKPQRPAPVPPVVSPKSDSPEADSDDEEEGDDSEPRRRRRRRRRRPEDEVTGAAPARPSANPPSSSVAKKIDAGGDWDESEEELPDAPAPRAPEPARSEDRRGDRPRREGSGRPGQSERRPSEGRPSEGRRASSRVDRGGESRRPEAAPSAAAQSAPARETPRPERGERRGSRDEARVESDDRPVRRDVEAETDVDDEGDSAGGRGGRNRRDRGRRKNTSRPEDWGEADFESIEDRVGFDDEDPEDGPNGASDEDEGAEPIVNFDDVPSWEEAISYLLKASPSDSGPSRGGPPRQRGGNSSGRRRR